jgi:hypothetical protein
MHNRAMRLVGVESSKGYGLLFLWVEGRQSRQIEWQLKYVSFERLCVVFHSANT